MEYTQSADFAMHGGTGNRMHSDTTPTPTAVTANDMNMLVWSCMEVVKAAGLTGIAFNPNDPASYQRLRDALNLLFITPAELASYAPSATLTLQGLVELATDAEAILGTDAVRALTPSTLAAVLSARTATELVTGLVELATSAESIAGTDATRAVHPAGLAAVLAASLPTRTGHVYTANDWAWVDRQERLVEQWGQAVAVPAGGHTVVTFPVPFTTLPVHTSATLQAATDGTSLYTIGSDPGTLTTLTIYNYSPVFATVNWRAKGKI